MEPQGFESQMIVGESFEGNVSGMVSSPPGKAPPVNISWNQRTDGVAHFSADTANPFHGLASQRIELVSGSAAAVSNRGLGNEGLVLHAGLEYTGYVFARAEKALTLTVALHDVTERSAAPKVLASAAVQIAGGGSWARYNYSLTPSSATACVFIPFGSDADINCVDLRQPLMFNATPQQTGHSCQRCGGEISFGLSKPGATHDHWWVAFFQECQQ